MGVLRYGTSSWGEKSWVGPFYPKGTKAGDFLTVYANEFDTVEADNTYYGVPRPQMVEGWDRKTPDGFTLCAKFPRAVVHGGEAARPDPERVLVQEVVGEETDLFFESMSLLGDKCGPLILQFPFFNRSVFPDRDEFLDRLGAYLETLPSGYRYGVEIRNKYWVDETLLAFLRERDVGNPSMMLHP